MQTFDPEEDADMVAAMLAAAVAGTTQYVEHPGMWEVVMRMLDEDNDNAVFAVRMQRVLTALLGGSTKSRDLRTTTGVALKQRMLEFHNRAMGVTQNVHMLIKVGELVPQVREQVLQVPSLVSEMQALDSASDILLADSKLYLENTVDAVEKGRKMGTDPETACDCEDCRNRTRKETAH